MGVRGDRFRSAGFPVFEYAWRKSAKNSHIVIPAKAGIQCNRRDVSDGIPVRVPGPRPSPGWQNNNMQHIQPIDSAARGGFDLTP